MLKRLVIFVLLIGLMVGAMYGYFILSIPEIERDPIYENVEFDRENLRLVDEFDQADTLNLIGDRANIIVEQGAEETSKVYASGGKLDIKSGEDSTTITVENDTYSHDNFVLISLAQDAAFERFDVQASYSKIHATGLDTGLLSADVDRGEFKVGEVQADETDIYLEEIIFFLGGPLVDDLNIDMRGGRAYIDINTVGQVDIQSILAEMDFHARTIENDSKFVHDMGLLLVSVHQDRDDYGLEIDHDNANIDVIGPDEGYYTFMHTMDLTVTDSNVRLRFNDHS